MNHRIVLPLVLAALSVAVAAPEATATGYAPVPGVVSGPPNRSAAPPPSPAPSVDRRVPAPARCGSTGTADRAATVTPVSRPVPPTREAADAVPLGTVNVGLLVGLGLLLLLVGVMLRRAARAGRGA